MAAGDTTVVGVDLFLAFRCAEFVLSSQDGDIRTCRAGLVADVIDIRTGRPVSDLDAVLAKLGRSMSELEVVLARFGAAIAERERERQAFREKP
jgi:hypothetical protein